MCGVGEVEWEEERDNESRSPARDSTGLTGGVSSPGSEPPGEGEAGPAGPRPWRPTVRPSSSPRPRPHPGNKLKVSSKNAEGVVGDPCSEEGGEGESAAEPRPPMRM